MRSLAATVASTVLALAGCGAEGNRFPAGWSLNGTTVTQEQLVIGPGTEHCDWTSVTFLRVAWPPGSEGASGSVRQFVRDPEGAVGPQYAERLDLTAQVPDDAAPSGFRNGDGAELWFADSDEGETAYLVEGSGDAEAWPRADPAVGCD
jgi:hypothetical protein